MVTRRAQMSLTRVCSLVQDLDTALFPFVDCCGLCALDATSRQWQEHAMGWRAAYACRFGTHPPEPGQTMEAKGGWKTLYLRSHFLRIQPGLRALGIKGGTGFGSVQPAGDEAPSYFSLQLPGIIRELRADFLAGDSCCAMHAPDHLDIAFEEDGDEVGIIAVYRADLGALELGGNSRLAGIRVGRTARELLDIAGAATEDIVNIDVHHPGIYFALVMIPHITFTLDDGQRCDLDNYESYGTREWWEAHLDRPIHCITNDLVMDWKVRYFGGADSYGACVCGGLRSALWDPLCWRGRLRDQ